jgi:hypothetical protein
MARIERLEHLVAHLNGGNSNVTVEAFHVVWEPGGVSHDNVFATFPEVVAAVASRSGNAVVTIADALGAPVIPAGNWDFRPPGTFGTVTFANGSLTSAFGVFVTIANAAVTIHGLTGLDFVQIFNQSTVDVITGSAADEVLFLMHFGSIFQSVNAAGAAFFKVTGGTNALILDDQSLIGTFDGGTSAIQVTGGAPGLFIQVNDSSSFQADMLVSAATLTQVNVAGPPASSPSFPRYAAQAAAPLINPAGLVETGSDAIVLGSGKSAAITAFIGPATIIHCTQRTSNGDGGVNPTVRYAALLPDRVNGNQGSFQISSLTVVGGGDTNLADASVVDWTVEN